MRVMLVSDFYAPYVGGVEQHVRSLAHALSVRGHDVTVVTSSTALAPRGRTVDGPVEVHRIPTLSAKVPGHADYERPWAPPIPDPVASFHLRRLIRRLRPDIVHGHDWLARSAMPWCRGAGAAFVDTMHYYTSSCARKDLWRIDAPCDGPALTKCVRCSRATYGRLKGAPVAVATRIGASLESAWSVRSVAVSEATAVGNRTERPYDVIPNMLPFTSDADASPVATTAPAEQAAALVPEERFLLFIGALRATKGFPTLVEAYRHLDDPPPLVVVGKIDRAVPADLPSGVHLIGNVDNELVPHLYERSLFGVVPSVWQEPFGIVTIEAMTAGRAVIVSDTGGLGELVDDGVTGLLVPPGDVDGLAKAMRTLIEDPARADEMGRRAAERVGRFDPTLVAAEYEAVYEAARVG